MPIYEYQCDDCGRISEVLKKGFEDTVETCEACGGQARRIMSNTSFVLKGTGWYVTDYCGKNASTGGGGNGNGEGAKKSEGSESASPASPASPASKAETAAASSSNGGSKPSGTATTCAG